MKNKTAINERRQHARASVKSIVVGVLNAAEPEMIGSITDISLGGVRFTCNAPKLAAEQNSIRSIDLIADENYVFDIPCDCAWNNRISTAETNSELIDLKQYGIRFGELTPWQLFQLRGLIEDFHAAKERVTELEART